MGIERLDEGDASAIDHGRRAADVPAIADPRTPADSPAFHYETRDREAYYAEYRAAVEAEYRAAREPWDGVSPQLREAWADHEKKWPSPERQRESPQPDIPGAWCGDGGRHLDPEANTEVDRGCDKIREVGEKVITPALCRIETQDQERQLIGLEYRFKGPDRLKEKVADQLRSTPSLRPDQALSVIPDAVRFTFRYDESMYTAGVRADTQRLQDAGFAQVERRNTWTSEQYRGVNSRWREPRSGQLFEVQFHTQASFDAKQLTHAAYERLRNPATTDGERDELHEFQRQVCRKIPIPSEAAEIDNYQLEQRDGRAS